MKYMLYQKERHTLHICRYMITFVYIYNYIFNTKEEDV